MLVCKLQQWRTGLKGVIMESSNNLIPLIIIMLFIIFIIIIGKIASFKVNSADDYIIANRNVGFWLILGTIFATFWGGGTIIGGAGSAYQEGLFGVIEDPFAAGLSLLILGIFFTKTLRKLKLKSIGELYVARFGKNTGYIASALMIPTYIIWTAVQLLAISKVLNVLFDLNFQQVFIVSAIVIAIFTYLGGLVAVIWTDAIQMIIIFIGLIIIVVFGINACGGIEVIGNNIPQNFFNPLPRENNLISWIQYIAMWVGMALGNLPSPDLAQRAFMAKDGKTAEKGMITAGILYWTVGFIPVIIALIGITLTNIGVIDPTLLSTDTELLIPIMAKQLLNPVMLGFFIASLIAAILSSASTSLFATAVLFSNDLYRPLVCKYKKNNEINMLKITRRFVIITTILAICVGLLSTRIYDLTVFAFTIQFSMLFFPFVLAIKSNKVNRYGIIAGMVTGFIINIYGCLSQQTILPTPWEFYTLVPALMNFIVIILVSRLTTCSQDQNIEILILKENENEITII